MITGNANNFKTNCDGKQLMVDDNIVKDIEFEWIMHENNNENNNVIITLGYAPHYTLVSVQSFIINQFKQNINTHEL